MLNLYCSVSYCKYSKHSALKREVGGGGVGGDKIDKGGGKIDKIR